MKTAAQLKTATSPAPASRPRTAGTPSPIGATVTREGVNFCLFSRTATGAELLLFDHADDEKPARVIPLDPVLNRTYHYWHVFVPGVRPGQIYGYRVQGPDDPARGLRFDAEKVLLDPYGRGVVIPDGYSRDAAHEKGDNAAAAMKSVVTDLDDYDWEGDAPLRSPSARAIIYEMHVGGFTKNPNSGVAEGARGTYAGLVEKIPYLQELGINTVELLPVFAFDPQDCPRGVVNYWGYAPVSFFAPHPAYSSRKDPLGPIDEFRDMVKALHRAGIEVILDVVYNHTAEGSHEGPSLSFRGIDNPNYYILEPNQAYYSNYSGCGNTLNANHPVVRRMIVDSLRYWVKEMHVDGFRFDLASILARDGNGHVLPNAPVLWDIESDPELAGIKLIAEAWDAAGLYQVGSFIGDSWKEWNGRFRDDVRDFFRGVPGAARSMADRVLGSHDVYGHKKREAEQSVNFVTCHDGFTLNDLVSYGQKHNEANGEGGRDGCDDNRSWNCGVEGPSEDAAIERLRDRQIRNFLTATLLSLGIPMIVMGDEVRRTQKGNNNGYCHDDESVWFDWSLVEKNAALHRFVRLLIARRVLRDVEHEEQRISLSEMINGAKKGWHGMRLNQPDWSEHSSSFAFCAEVAKEKLVFHLIFNAHWEALEFELPLLDGGTGWRRWIDTVLPSPDDITDWDSAAPVPGDRYSAGPRSVVVLIADAARVRWTGLEGDACAPCSAWMRCQDSQEKRLAPVRKTPNIREMNKMSRRLSNHYSDCRLVSLAKLKTAAEFAKRDRNGPYVIMQYGYDPNDPAMRAHDFLLGRSGAWLAMHWFIRLPVPERRDEFLFSTVVEVLAQMEQMTGKVRVISNRPENVDEDGEVDTELEQVLRG